MRRAFVLSSGGSWGAWVAVALAELIESIPTDYYDAVYCPSASGFSAAKGFTDPRGLELIWRTYTTGRQFVDLSNFVSRFCLQSPYIYFKPVMNLSWLTYVLRNPSLCPLDLKAFARLKTRFIYPLTHIETGQTHYYEGNKDTVFTLQEATSAIPPLHPPVRFEGEIYCDGGLTDPIPVVRAWKDGYRNITIISCYPADCYNNTRARFIEKCGAFLSPVLRQLILTKRKRFAEIEEFLTLHPEILKQTARPEKFPPPIHVLDFNHVRINAACDDGRQFMRRFLRSQGLRTA